MAGHSAFSTNLDGIKHVALGNTAIKKIGFFSNNVMDVVWSGASLVSYYDGATLLGQREVDEGQDVLRPSGLTAQNLVTFPYRNASKVEHGITWTVNADGTITANGTADANSWFDVIPNSQEYYLPVGSYKVVGCPSGGGASKYGIWVTHGSEYTQYVREFGSGETFNITSATASETFRVVLGVQNGQTVNNLTFKPMVVDATLFPDVTYNDFVLYGMNKTGYTHVGWTGYGGTERFETKVATGEPMSLYALFVPNSIVVYISDVTYLHYNSYRNWEYTYSIQTKNANYISGTLMATCQCNEWNSARSESSFNLNKKYYNTATAIFNAQHGYLDVGYLDWGGGIVDSEAFSTRFKGDKTLLLDNGSHTITAVVQSFDDYKDRTLVFAKRITLSNPTKWA